ncbi:uncharacterized protein B0H18DRAFT_982709 [Fomitopsis serialis]|uniref:uncharacterized protein n=1 Tax=Fomitopsis serialis TaxID=139415 RepID=UPI0020078B68|nr:uncharacterized protein B0H18DRAFT_982709 [Neoantrodia serialis]KAH9933909.1 hypothetical protein B0H18DRAFT_982709 [Neoantrodia serialis]
MLNSGTVARHDGWTGVLTLTTGMTGRYHRDAPGLARQAYHSGEPPVSHGHDAAAQGGADGADDEMIANRTAPASPRCLPDSPYRHSHPSSQVVSDPGPATLYRSLLWVDIIGALLYRILYIVHANFETGIVDTRPCTQSRRSWDLLPIIRVCDRLATHNFRSRRHSYFWPLWTVVPALWPLAEPCTEFNMADSFRRRAGTYSRTRPLSLPLSGISKFFRPSLHLGILTRLRGPAFINTLFKRYHHEPCLIGCARLHHTAIY